MSAMSGRGMGRQTECLCGRKFHVVVGGQLMRAI